MASTFRETVSLKTFYDISACVIALPSVLIVARLGLQIWQRKNRELQDFLIYGAYIFFLAMSICYLVVIKTIYDISKVRVGQMRPWKTFMEDKTDYIRMMFVTNNLFWFCIWSVKLSLLNLYKKLMDRLPGIYMKLWWGVFAFCIVTLIGCIISYFTSCDDFAASMRIGDCAGPKNARAQIISLYFSYAVDVVTDLMIMALPIKLVWNLQLAHGQKIAVIALFMSGFVCVIFATLRVTQIAIKAGNEASPSPTWLALWTIIEGAVAVCIGCGPAFAMSYRRVQRSTAPDSQGYIRQGPSDRGTNRSRLEDIKLVSHIGASKSQNSRGETNWGDSSSQEELAPPLKDIVITRTIQMDNGDTVSVNKSVDERGIKDDSHVRQEPWC